MDPHDSLVQTGSSKGSPQAWQYITLVWGSLLRWWKYAIPLGLLLGASAAVAAWLAVVPIYKAEATLRIREQTPFIAFKADDRMGTFLRTQLQLFKTRAVHAPALREIRMKRRDVKDKENPYEWIEKSIQAQVAANSELVSVTFEDPDADLAKITLDAIINSYIKYNAEVDDLHNKAVIKLLEEEKTNLERELKLKRDDIKRKSQEVTDSPTEDVIREDPMSPRKSLDTILVQTMFEIQYASAQLAAFNAFEFGEQDMEIPEFEMEQLIESQPQHIELQQRIKAAQDRLDDFEETFLVPQSSRRYRQLSDDLVELKKDLQTFRDEFRDEARTTITSRMLADREIQKRQLENEIKSKNAMKVFLESRLEESAGVAGVAKAKEVNLEFLKTDLRRHTDVYDRISERIVTMQTEKRAPPRVRVVDFPSVPTTPEGSRTVMVLAAAIAGLFLPLALVTVWEFFLQRVNDSSLIRDRNMSVLGEIASLPKYLPPPDEVAANGHRRLTLFEESIDHLCTSLRLSPEMADKRIIAIVSAISGEGKTHVATQLSISLSRGCKEPVLLVESDFRAPDVGRLLGVKTEPGLLDVFSNRCTLDEAISRGVDSHLDVLAAGVQTSDLHALLHQQHIHDLFEELQARYRYVVIDTPPILAAGESLLFTALADATLICARRGYSRLSQVQQVHERLIRTQANPVGVVLNGVPRRRYLHSYGSYEYTNA